MRRSRCPPGGARCPRAAEPARQSAGLRALVLVAAVAGVSTEETAFGAQLFFWARVAHAGIYIAGIPWVRALAFIAGLSGMFDIAAAVLRA